MSWEKEFDKKWKADFIHEFVNDHGTEWRPLRGLWVEDVTAFIEKTISQALESQMSDLKKEVESMRVPDIFGQKRNIQGETIDQVLLLMKKK